MARLVIHNDKISNPKQYPSLCPFNALELIGGKLEVNAGCKMCGLCAKNAPNGTIEFIKEARQTVNKNLWKGILVFVEQDGNNIHPVTFELIGKAKELAQQVGFPVYAIVVGNHVESLAQQLLCYGVDKVFLYEHPELEFFSLENYTRVLVDFAEREKPSSILVGATVVGRQLAPRAAARLRTGLTADCTTLEMRENTDLVQIRPAFGGNIMAEIITPNHRPQMATVRYKVMEEITPQKEPHGEVIFCRVPLMETGVTKLLCIEPKQQEEHIESVDILVVAGRGMKKKEDIQLAIDLADSLNGQIACTRPLAEAGWVDTRRQIGLSGRTVRPKLIITCGVSGAVQFTAGMNSSDTIIAINEDENAPIFQMAHYGLVGDLYKILPKLTQLIKDNRKEDA